MTISVKQIGAVHCGENGYSIVLKPEYAAGLSGLEGYGHIQVVWWCDGCDDERSRAKLTISKPYTNGPETLGVFATRSPERPNPIAISAAQVTYIDAPRGVVGLAWTDANDGTPVLDIKPYVPSVDRVGNPTVPGWCSHWPKSAEESGDFDWASEFTFQDACHESE